VEEDVHEGCTLFVRDLPYDATEEQIKKAFRSFGKIRFVAIVKGEVFLSSHFNEYHAV
jgi:RNA recognition motif-containing protein